MDPGARLCGAILCGGTSSRMGRDKASLELGGVTLLDRAIANLAAAADPILVASGDGPRFPSTGLREVCDDPSHGGPVAGMAAALAASPHPLVAVVAVDMPLASADVLRLLASSLDGGDAAIPHDGHRLQPLHAVYATHALPRMRRFLAGGKRRVSELVETLDVKVAGPESWGALRPGDFARNVNDPSDLEALARALGGDP